MTDPPAVITIDGPAASGKSTVGKIVAERLGFLYLDTGAMYRAITLLALRHDVPLDEEHAVASLAQVAQLELRPPRDDEQDGRQYTVRLDGEDITWEIRAPIVDRHVSQVAAHAAVREEMVRQQRRIGLQGRVVMVGRDIGTVVVPEAPLKIYLDASLEARAQRRYRDALERGTESDYTRLLEAMQKRDLYDQSRAHSPMRPAEDAVCLMSTDCTVEEMVQSVLALAEERLDVAPAR